MMLNFNSYEDLKDKLQIRIYDPDFSRNLLEGKTVTYIGDFALVYMATLYESKKKLGNLMFTPELMDDLGIDVLTLHRDASTLKYISEQTGKNVSEIVRDGIKSEYRKLMKWD